MADQNNEEIMDLGDAIRVALDSLRRGLDIPPDALRALDRSARRAAQAQNEAAKEAAAFKEALKSLSPALTGMLGAVGKGNTAFTVFNGTITAMTNVVGELLGALPLVGGALKGLTQAAGQATNYMIDQYQSAYGAFEQLSQAGAAGAGGIEDVRTQFKELGMPIEAMSAIVARNSQRLAGLSGTVLDASKQFTQTAGALKEVDDQGNRLDMQLRVLGYSSEEIADTMIQYADLQRRFGAQQTLSNDQLAAGTLAYGKELDAIAKLTGMNRKQLQSEMDQMMLNERFAAKIRDMQLNGQEAAAKELQAAVLAQMAMGNKQMGSAIMAAATGFYTTPEAKAAAATIPGFADNVNALTDGSIKMAQFTQNLQDSAVVAEQQYRGLAQAVGSNTVATQMYNEQLNLATRDAGKVGEAITGAYDAIDKGQSVMDPATKSLAGSRANLEEAAANISSIATDFTLVAAGVESFSKAIKDITAWIEANISATPGMKEDKRLDTTNGLLTEIRNIQEQIRDHDSGAAPLSDDKLSELKNSLDALNETAKQQVASYKSAIPGFEYGRTRPQMEARDALENYVNRIESGEQDKGAVLPTIPQFWKNKEWQPETTDSNNQPYLENFKPNPNYTPPAKPTAPTDKQIQETEEVTPTAPTQKLSPTAPTPPETQQSLAYGGVATGPKSGYRATLHGTEAVVPLEGQKIPVEIQDSRDMKPQMDLMERQIAKLDAVIDAIQKHTAVSEKMFRSNYS